MLGSEPHCHLAPGWIAGSSNPTHVTLSTSPPPGLLLLIYSGSNLRTPQTLSPIRPIYRQHQALLAFCSLCPLHLSPDFHSHCNQPSSAPGKGHLASAGDLTRPQMASQLPETIHYTSMSSFLKNNVNVPRPYLKLSMAPFCK